MATKPSIKKTLLKKSIDYTVCKRGIVVYGIIVSAVIVIFALISILTKNALFLLVPALLLILYTPFACSSIARMISIIGKSDDFIICESVLSNPQPGFNATIYFTVKVKDSNNDSVELTTMAIGSTRGIVRPHFSELNDKKVLVAHNLRTDDIVVLKLL